MLGIPAPFAWVGLAFVTSHIPYVGFVIGLLPPVVLWRSSYGSSPSCC